MFGLFKKNTPERPEDWNQRKKPLDTRMLFENRANWRDASEAASFPSIEQWSQQVGQAAIDEYWENDGATVTQEQFLAQVNAWAYVARDFGDGAFYIMVGAPEAGIGAVMTVRYLNEDVFTPEDYHEYLKTAQDIQSNLVTPIEFETLEVPAGPAAHSSYRMTDFFNGVDTLVYRDNYLIFPPNVNAAVEISGSWVPEDGSWVIKEETLGVAETLRIVPKDYKGT